MEKKNYKHSSDDQRSYPVMTQVLMKGKSIKLPKGNELKREKFREVLKGKTK